MNFVCPQCGFSLDADSNKVAPKAKLMSCSSCNSSLLIENNTISLSELNVVKNIQQSLFTIDSSVLIKNTEYTPQGYSLYEYNEGQRIEWELVDADKNAYFLNQEDENLFLVKQIPEIPETLQTWESLQPNTQLKIQNIDWLVVEQLQVSFVAYAGKLQNLPLQNTKLKCVYLSNTQGECMVLTFINNHQKAYQGWWLDPMDLS